MNNEDKYYLLYEDRYRRIHDQGFDYWNSSPEENSQTLAAIDRFLSWFKYLPGDVSIIEFGCGQGILAEYLVKLGYNYLGIDISESAISKARERTGKKGRASFMHANVVTDLVQIPASSFDIAIDNQCLHMLLTDEHRSKYLAGMNRLLKNDGVVFLRENIQPEEFTQHIISFRDWLGKTDADYTTLYDYPAYSEGTRHTIRLPRVPARFNNEKGYRKELEKAGYIVEKFIDDGHMCIIYTTVSKEGRID